MSDIILKIEDVSKLYRLGNVGTGTLSHDIRRWWHIARGKEDPYMKIGEENTRDSKGTSEYVWALKGVSFNVKQGEVLGIIGKNGAGKSTLLKILSRVTGPTTGEYRVRGRIASLLEVGTGFHSDLTGRENIFLNGAILGMTKAEIKTKLDEIIAFSGVERYIDTPVKRYSSGMTVRLAFAVAAHLEPEILIIDEVLAVGDAEFQKKCLGKMKDVAGEGRTVLFVSHNMLAVKSLCHNALLLNDGKIVKTGYTQEVIETYLNTERQVEYEKRWDLNNAPGNKDIHMLKASIISDDIIQTGKLTTESEIVLEFILENTITDGEITLTIHFCGLDNTIAFASVSNYVINPAKYLKFRCTIPAKILNSMIYKLDVLFEKNEKTLYNFASCLQFEIHDGTERKAWFGKWPGVVRPYFKWEEISEKEMELTTKLT